MTVICLPYLFPNTLRITDLLNQHFILFHFSFSYSFLYLTLAITDLD